MRFPCSPQRRADFVLSHASVRGIKSFGMLLCVRLSVALSLACPPSWAALLTPPSPSPYRGTTTGHLPRRQRRRRRVCRPPRRLPARRPRLLRRLRRPRPARTPQPQEEDLRDGPARVHDARQQGRGVGCGRGHDAQDRDGEGGLRGADVRGRELVVGRSWASVVASSNEWFEACISSGAGEGLSRKNGRVTRPASFDARRSS